MLKGNNLSPSLEDYLESILFLEKKNRVARVKDIAELLKVQMPSVTGALKNLREKNLVEYEKNSFIVLTESGKKIADSVQKRHDILTKFLKNILLLKNENAEDQACQIEHIITPGTAKRIKNLTIFMENFFSKNKDYSREEWEKILSEDK